MNGSATDFGVVGRLVFPFVSASCEGRTLGVLHRRRLAAARLFCSRSLQPMPGTLNAEDAEWLRFRGRHAFAMRLVGWGIRVYLWVKAVVGSLRGRSRCGMAGH